MELPKYYETFIPILKVLSDGQVIHYKELSRRVANDFYSNLPQELLELKTKAGDSLFFDRIGWAKVYLKQAEIIRQPERGMVQITDKGREIVKKESLTLKEVLNDTDFIKNRTIVSDTKEEGKIIVIDENDSPQERIDSGIKTIEEQVKSDLLAKFKMVDPYLFEEMVLKLLKKMGYGEYTKTSKSRDGGIDGIMNIDALGIEKIYVQSKRFNENKVGELDIRNFIGAMSSSVTKGIFVTTSSFDGPALNKIRDAHNNKIIPIDGKKLAELMYEYEVGVQLKNTYSVKQIDEDFFELE